MRTLATAIALAIASTANAEIRRVIVVHMASTRPDVLGCYGGLAETPNIDAIAATGRRYDNSIVVTPDGGPSIASFMTGRHTNRHGVYQSSQMLQDPMTTLAEVLQANGFKTAAFVSSPMLGVHSDMGFDQGFDDYDRHDTPSPDVTDGAVNFISQHVDDRFFVWMYLHDTHAPFTPASPYDTMYEGHPDLLAESQRLSPAVIDQRAYTRGLLHSHEYLARHLGEVTMVDREIGRIRHEVANLDGETLWVITADHGMSFGDLGAWFGYGLDVRHTGIDVPLIIACTGHVPQGASTALAANTDLAPTILDLLDLDTAPLEPYGVSLAPTFTDRDPWPDRIVPIQSHNGERWRGVRSARYSLHSQFEGGTGDYVRSFLYDRTTDPREMTNLATNRPEVFETHFAAEKAWFVQPRIRPQYVKPPGQAAAPTR